MTGQQLPLFAIEEPARIPFRKQQSTFPLPLWRAVCASWDGTSRDRSRMPRPSHGPMLPHAWPPRALEGDCRTAEVVRVSQDVRHGWQDPA
jgi:hypothetical protein